VRSTTNEYMRVSVSYRVANGDVATSSMAAQPTLRPPRRLPATQASGTVTTPNRPERERTASSEVPNQPIQKCRRT
jgi:hypothetical protein